MYEIMDKLFMYEIMDKLSSTWINYTSIQLEYTCPHTSASEAS